MQLKGEKAQICATQILATGHHLGYQATYCF